MSDLAAALERAHIGRSRFDLQHRGYVLAAILAAEAFLEAVVNELFQDAVDRHNLAGDGYLAPLSSDVHLLMARTWTAAGGGRGLSPLERYHRGRRGSSAPRFAHEAAKGGYVACRV